MTFPIIWKSESAPVHAELSAYDINCRKLLSRNFDVSNCYQISDHFDLTRLNFILIKRHWTNHLPHNKSRYMYIAVYLDISYNKSSPLAVSALPDMVNVDMSLYRISMYRPGNKQIYVNIMKHTCIIRVNLGQLTAYIYRLSDLILTFNIYWKMTYEPKLTFDLWHYLEHNRNTNSYSYLRYDTVVRYWGWIL